MSTNTKRSKPAPARSTAKASRSRAPKKKVRSRFTAKTADRYELYQMSVQSPDDDLAFLTRVYKRMQGRTPLHLREDFCGTALMCSTWVKKNAKHTAEGFDLDPEALAW